jgi:hypothetical protein
MIRNFLPMLFVLSALTTTFGTIPALAKTIAIKA